MSFLSHQINEQNAAAGFTKQAVVFDETYSGNTIIQYKRERVRSHLLQFILPESNVLELNSGTGEDAVWLAQQGFTVHATDNAKGMLDQLQQKVTKLNLGNAVTNELISFTQLQNLQRHNQYGHIFSNFAGLNCTGELDKVLRSFSALLKPGGKVTLAILPKFCLWEFLLLFKGKFKTAFRRLFSSKGVTAHVEGKYFTCWYYNPSYIIKTLKNEFDVLNLEGLCTLVPPSYIEGFAEKHPKLYAALKTKENKWKSKWPWRSTGDYYIITLKKKDHPL